MQKTLIYHSIKRQLLQPLYQLTPKGILIKQYKENYNRFSKFKPIFNKGKKMKQQPLHMAHRTIS